jgi:hypothetical protein
MRHVYSQNVNFDAKGSGNFVLRVIPYRFAIDIHSQGEDAQGGGDLE